MFTVILGITELLAPLCNQANMLVKNESLWRSLLFLHLISLSLALISKRVETLSSNFLWLVLKWTPSVRVVQLESKSNAWSVCICLWERVNSEVIVPFNVVGFKNRFFRFKTFFFYKNYCFITSFVLLPSLELSCKGKYVKHDCCDLWVYLYLSMYNISINQVSQTSVTPSFNLWKIVDFLNALTHHYNISWSPFYGVNHM